MGSSNSAQGIVATFGTTALGKVTNITGDTGVIVLDDTDLSHDRENNQAGIVTASVSIDCLGDEESGVEGVVAGLELSGTSSKDFGDMLCQTVGLGATVKGQRTTRYAFVTSNVDGT